jgi:hypothetical protein
MNRFLKTKLKMFLFLPLLLLLAVNCSGGNGSSSSGGPCKITKTVALPADSVFDIENTYYSLGTPDAVKNCPAVWNVCVSYTDYTTAAANLTEPDIVFTFGVNEGTLLFDTPFPSIAESTPEPGVSVVEWCRDLKANAKNDTAASTSYWFSAQANFTPPVDGSMDVSIKASIRYTPNKPSTGN